MARKRKELTPIQVKKGERPKWRKMVNGKYHYFRGSYEEALTAWHQKQVEMQQQAEPPRKPLTQAYLEKMKLWYELRGDTENAKRINANDPFDWEHISPEGKAIWFDRFRLMDEQQASKKKPTVNTAVDMFVARQHAKVSGSQITAGRYDTLQRCCRHFASFVGQTASVDRITGHVLEAYHSHLLEQIGEKGWSPDYAQTYMIAARQFTRWAWKTELLSGDLPRNIDDKELSITIPKKKIKTFSVDEIKSLLANASERTKLYLLVMLNIGATQKDISDLRPEEVDWKAGKVTRRRSKTKDAEGVPTVSYPLWAETFRLLKKFGNREGASVLTNEDGGPLKVEELRNGKLVKIDNIAVAYHRLCVKLKIKTKKPLKLLRKTSPTALESNKDFAHCARYFLAHSPRGVADSSYIAPDQATFDRAVIWLGTYYGVTSSS